LPNSFKEIHISPLALILLLVLSIMSYTVSSSLSENITISSSGVIVYQVRPLHVEGRYIKDDLGNIVILRGVNKVGFEDYSGGIWMGKAGWDANRVKQELDIIASWGVNVIRVHQCVKWWKYDIDNHRQHIKDLITYAGERGLYVIFDGFQVQDYFSGGSQDLLPYPPYQSGDWSDIIANESEFVDYWRSVAMELKDFPNVIFELWNEACGGRDEERALSWQSAAQQCVDAIRSVGADQIIIIQFFWDIWYDASGFGNHGDLSWIEEYPINGTNIVYSTHLYPYNGLGSDRPYDIETIRTRLEELGVKRVGETLNLPLIIGEIGCNLAADPLEEELIRFNNTLTVFDEWGLGYIGFWWRATGIYRLISDYNGTPTESGLIFKNHTMSSY